MAYILVDANTILDVATHDPIWFDWSRETLNSLSTQGTLAINPVIFAEISIRYQRIEVLENDLQASGIKKLHLPWEAAFLAGKCFREYRKRGGTKSAPLPDFFIGAHAQVEKLALVTRDVARYRTYFPSLKLIAPP